MIDPDRFWNLLPQFHQMRDADTGFKLRALLEVMSEQAALIDADIARQYDNWFIETCEDWVVPYIADAIGYTKLYVIGDPDPDLEREAEALQRIVTPRREVANTIRYRRRKGTLAVLEDIATDVTGWPSRAVEFRHQVLAMQHLRSLRPTTACTAAVRGAVVGGFGGPADRMARVAEVRRISSSGRAGRYGPHQVGLFVARQEAVSVTRADAACADMPGPHCFYFSPLGIDVPLFWPGLPKAGMLPGPLTRAMLAGALAQPETSRAAGGPHATPPQAAIYGDAGCLMVYEQPTDADKLVPVSPDRIVAARLRDWRDRPTPGKVALDPECGQLMFPERDPPSRVVVTYMEGSVGDLGATERVHHTGYDVEPASEVIKVGIDAKFDSLAAALHHWSQRRSGKERRAEIIEILDSRTYNEKRLMLDLQAGDALMIRAASRHRPVLRVIDYNSARDEAWQITLGAGSSLVLDGLLISGRRLHIRGDGGTLKLRRCTLMPGWDPWLNPPGQPLPSSLVMDGTTTALRIQHSIIGPLHVRDDDLAHEPAMVEITDSVIHGGGIQAIDGPGSIAAHIALTIKRCTVLGRCVVHELPLAENSLFTHRVLVARRQRGCVRFCFLPPDSKVPQRFECLPTEHDEFGIAPVFVSQRYGDPGYCQLSRDCPAEIRRGASDQSEMGVFHNLFTPQREANLQARLEEYVPADVDAGVIYVT